MDRLKAAGQVKALNFLVNLPNPNQIVTITKLIDSLKGAAAGQAAFKILADSSSATDAIRKLQALVVQNKKFSINADTCC